MTRLFIAACTALAIGVTPLLSGCNMMGAGGTGGQQGSPTVASQTTILALQTWLTLEQTKASAAGKTARARLAGSLIGNLTALRTEPNCASRLSLANTVSAGLQQQFPDYQAELGLGTNLVTVLASGYPGCQ